MHRIITIPIQIIIGFLLMAQLAIHLSMAMFWLFFIGLILFGNIFRDKPEKRRILQKKHPPS